MKYKNGFFQIIHKEDGTYVKLFPVGEDGEKLKIEDIMQYLHLLKIDEFEPVDLKNAMDLVKDAPVEHKVSGKNIYPEHERLKIEVNRNRTQAKVRFYPPSNKGKLLTKSEIMSELEHRGIRHGILERNIDIYLKQRQFCTDFVIAKATMPVQGKNAKITYHFETKLVAKPKIKEDGSVDFHQMDNINHIEEGALLATLEPAEFGKPGIDVYGEKIKQAKVDVRILKHGRNIHLSPDGTKMFSDVSGHVSLVEDKVFVSNTYEVPADVSTSTGDIEYDGNVHVKGNVITGFKIEAKGDIIVDGVVEGATLIAGGQIVLRRGIQGMNRGVLRAEGDIVTKFIENSEVYSGGAISTDAIMHSTVVAKGDVSATGKRGLINGGVVKSEGNISLKEAGSTMGTKTFLEIGMDPALLEEYQMLDKEIVQMTDELETHNKTIGIYANKVKKGEKLPEDRLLLYNTAKANAAELKERIETAQNRSEELRQEMEAHSNGRIKVYGVAYPGVKVVITTASYFVRSEVHRTQFVKDRALIKTLML